MTANGTGGRSERFVLAVDLGSSVLKVGLVSLDGRIAWWTQADLETVHGPAGAATQDAEQWWENLADATRKGLAEGTVRGDQVVAVAVTGQWSSTVPVDAAGSPVGPCLMWMDTRGQRHSEAVLGGRVQGYRARTLVEWVRRTGGLPSRSGGDAVGNLLYLERDATDIARAAAFYLEPVDYLTMRFTGVPSATQASMFPTWLIDNRRTDVQTYDSTLLGFLGLDAAKLPRLLPTGSAIGAVAPSVAAELGINPGTVVVNGLPDLHASAVGSGCLAEHQTHLAISTTTWVSCPVSRKKTDLLRQMAAVPGLWPGQYLLVDNQRTSGRCLEWLRDEVLAPPDGLLAGPAPTYESLLELAATTPPGAGGVIFTPWLDGENSPAEDAHARAGFHNLSLHTTRAHLVRAVLEGVAFNARWLLEAADHFTGRRLDPVRLVGGGVRSDLWCQIVADVCDRTVERVADPVLSGLRGAALYAGLVLGDVSREEVHDLVPVDATFTADPANRAVYDRLFAEVPRLFKGQRGMFRRLNG
ncbi:MAG TPA: FGGY-family carbohydrate kinase [Nocardioidaceae bacterium]|nr:FGGY-family carbohydrate kinase [Nocardioidaceae bacterium]